jgi:hypothetical protein
MSYCSLPQATHFYIVNYDERVSIVPKEVKNLLINDKPNKYTICFTNRYMTYIVDENETVRLLIYDYKEKIKSLTNLQEV